MSHQSLQIEINVNHIRECLLRNDFITQLGNKNFREEPTNRASSTPSDEFKHLLVVNVIRHNTHIVEQLLVSMGKLYHKL